MLLTDTDYAGSRTVVTSTVGSIKRRENDIDISSENLISLNSRWAQIERSSRLTRASKVCDLHIQTGIQELGSSWQWGYVIHSVAFVRLHGLCRATIFLSLMSRKKIILLQVSNEPVSLIPTKLRAPKYAPGLLGLFQKGAMLFFVWFLSLLGFVDHGAEIGDPKPVMIGFHGEWSIWQTFDQASLARPWRDEIIT